MSLNAICATVAIGIASTAFAGGYNCTVAIGVTCDPGCGAFYEGPAFACCSTYGTSCCARTCHVYQCLEGPLNGPCNSANQIISSAGATINYTACQNGNSCQNAGQ